MLSNQCFIILKNATEGRDKIIGDSFRKEPSNLISTIDEAETKLMTGQYAFVYVRIIK